eukprot:TRINITY_DN6873_c0_g1_i1.p1 TRINITY_DN6873_c0_g1~~TRINITY_DN6873_c0_g1_i1.p1  ORF type:complete len:514 (+),score=73.08 TRINITY_DN6873_c0_g1_i1:75-1616(+)
MNALVFGEPVVCSILQHLSCQQVGRYSRVSQLWKKCAESNLIWYKILLGFFAKSRTQTDADIQALVKALPPNFYKQLLLNICPDFLRAPLNYVRLKEGKGGGESILRAIKFLPFVESGAGVIPIQFEGSYGELWEGTDGSHSKASRASRFCVFPDLENLTKFMHIFLDQFVEYDVDDDDDEPEKFYEARVENYNLIKNQCDRFVVTPCEQHRCNDDLYLSMVRAEVLVHKSTLKKFKETLVKEMSKAPFRRKHRSDKAAQLLGTLGYTRGRGKNHDVACSKLLQECQIASRMELKRIAANAAIMSNVLRILEKDKKTTDSQKEALRELAKGTEIVEAKRNYIDIEDGIFGDIAAFNSSARIKISYPEGAHPLKIFIEVSTRDIEDGRNSIPVEFNEEVVNSLLNAKLDKFLVHRFFLYILDAPFVSRNTVTEKLRIDFEMLSKYVEEQNDDDKEQAVKDDFKKFSKNLGINLEYLGEEAESEPEEEAEEEAPTENLKEEALENRQSKRPRTVE